MVPPSRSGGGLQILLYSPVSEQDWLQGSQGCSSLVSCKRNESSGSIGAMTDIKEDFQVHSASMIDYTDFSTLLFNQHVNIRAVGRALSTPSSLDFDRSVVNPSISPLCVPMGEEERGGTLAGRAEVRREVISQSFAWQRCSV